MTDRISDAGGRGHGRAVAQEGVWRALREACVTMLAAVATLLCALALDPQAATGVLAVVLCLSLARSHLDSDLRGRIEAAIALPAVGLAAVGAGLLLQRAPWLGALVFVTGMFMSIWLRRFGALAKRLGALLALPLVALLVTPHAASAAGPIPAPLVPLLVGWLALAWVSVLHALARRLRVLAPATPASVGPMAGEAPARDGTLRPIASTRMAMQMAVALALSFAVGYAFFAERWAWIVLTAFIVGSGNRGRLDVAHKSVLRVLGAAGGTALALFVSAHAGAYAHAGAHGPASVALILGAVFLGVWLRPLGYAWWALCITVALALLQGFAGGPPASMLWLRLEEIVIGAAIGVASAWWVLPVDSGAALRRRLADALAALAEALDPANPARTAEHFIAALAALDQMAPAFRASRLVTRRFRPVQPADWIDALLACGTPAVVLIDSGATPGPVRRAVGAARKALRDPEAILPALNDLAAALESTSPPRPAVRAEYVEKV